MTDKSGSCRVVTFAPVKSLDDFTQERLEEFFDVVSVDYTDDGLEIYKGYKNASFKEEELATFIAANGLDLPACTIELLESANWLKDYVIQFAPVEVEDFLIYGVHEKKAPQTDKLAIRIYAATAFGSEHQTTKSCLRALSELNRKTCRTPVFSMSAPAREYCRWLLPNFGAKPRRLPPWTLTKKPPSLPAATPKTTVLKIHHRRRQQRLSVRTGIEKRPL